MKKINYTLVITFVSLSIFITFGNAENIWESIGPEGGWAGSVAIDPMDNQTILVGTKGGIFKSTDGGTTWSEKNTGIFWPRIDVLKFDHLNPSIVYAVADYYLFKSSDKGETWSVTNQVLNYQYIYDILIHPNISGIVYAGLRNSGIYMSTDGGETWIEMNQGLTNLNVQCLAANHTDPAILYAGTDGGGIYKSTDDGETWTLLNDGLSVLDIKRLAVDYGTPSTLYAGTELGVYRMTDGEPWTLLNNTPRLYSGGVLSTHPTNHGTVYAGYINQLHKSSDSGDSWIILDQFFETLLDVDLHTNEPDTLLVASHLGVFKSTNGGNNWAELTSGLCNVVISSIAIDVNSSETMYVSSDWNGLIKTTNGGESWTEAYYFPAFQYITIDPLNTSTLYAAAGGNGIFKSMNSGVTWERVRYEYPTSLPSNFNRMVMVDPFDNSIVYVGTDGGVIKSNDGGENWSESLIDSSIFALDVDQTNPGILYASGGEGLVFKSTDYGETWSSGSEISPGETIRIWSLKIDPKNSEKIYACASYSGLFMSIDAGINWNKITSYSSNDVAIDPFNSNILYIASASSGVYRSVNGGTTWAEVNDGFNTIWVSNIIFDPNVPNRIYAGTYGNGVYRYDHNSFCLYDIDNDGDVDGSDLSSYAGDRIILQEFADDFGRNDCFD